MSRTGPIEDHPWPEKLTAHTITPGEAPRLYGYSVQDDLAHHYRFTDLVLLSLTGELPDEQRSAAFDVALQFLAPLSVAEAPTHAAVLARLCGSQPSGMSAITAIALAERARSIVQEHEPFLSWLAAPAPAGDPPASFRASTEDDRATVAALRRALEARAGSTEILAHDLSRPAALLAILHGCGLTRAATLEAALVIASLAPSVGEAMKHDVASFRKYPMQLPPFEYEDP